jgi:hypothetical protein
MKKIKSIVIVSGLSCLSAIAQNQQTVYLPEINLEVQKIENFFRKDAYENPYTSQEIQSFIDYIDKNPIIREVDLNQDPIIHGVVRDQNPVTIKLDANEKLARRKIKMAQQLFEHTNDPADKKKLADLLIKTFPALQAARDKLGIDPLSEEEGWLYIGPKPSPEDAEGTKNPWVSTQRWINRDIYQTNNLCNSIGILTSLHTTIYQILTEEMKVKLEGIPKVLERSPEEKARTKEMLEKYAAENGQKKFKIKANENQAK